MSREIPYHAVARGLCFWSLILKTTPNQLPFMTIKGHYHRFGQSWHTTVLIKCINSFVRSFMSLPRQSMVKALGLVHPYIQEPLNASQFLFLHLVSHIFPHELDEYLSILQPENNRKMVLISIIFWIGAVHVMLVTIFVSIRVRIYHNTMILYCYYYWTLFIV